MRPMRVALAGVIAALMLILAACGENSGGSSSGPIDLTFWYTQGQNESQPILKIVNAFNSSQANIHVTAQAVDFGSAHDQFAAAAKAGTGAPDIMRVDVSWIAEFAKADYLLDLTNRVGDTSDFLPSALANDTYNGKLYALPETIEFPVLYYNKALLATANITQPPATMDVLNTDASETTQANTGLYGFATQGTTLFVTPFLFADGGDLIAGDGKTPLVNSAASVSGFNRLLAMIKADAVLPFNAASATTDAENGFAAGHVAMLIGGSWEVAALQQGAAFQGANAGNFGIAAIPTGSAGAVPRALAGGESYAIYQGSPHAAAALTFLKYLDAATQQSAVAQANGTLPARLSAYTSVVLQNATIQSFYALLATAKARPVVPNTGTLFTTFDSDIQPALAGTSTAQDALNKVAQDWQPLLAGS
jgi:arabinogalactan oligomer/maltooligosaccharide transport system substrate-binding protein